MAVLSEAERIKLRNHFMRNSDALTDVLKADIKGAVDAVDQWVEDNAVSFNNALPATFKANATAQQKGLVLCYVVMRKYNILTTEDD